MVFENTLKSASAALLLSHAFAAEEKAPQAFVTNCQACHVLDRAVVGPSLVELAQLYPKKDKATFVKWCVDPQKKRPLMPQMPSMAHIPEKELVEIHDYILKVTVGVEKVRPSKEDPYAAAPANTRRPRVIRTFVPESGPSSMIIALPTPEKLNLIWDTDKCRLRYISQGEPDNYPYLRSNGNSFAKVGDILYRELGPVFPSDETQFKGMTVSKEGFPSLIYTVAGAEITETFSVDGSQIKRTFSSSGKLPDHQQPKQSGNKLVTTIEPAAGHLTITHAPK